MDVGDRYGRLIIKSIGREKVHCACDCGEEKLLGRQDVSQGKTRSCGCLRKEVMTKHGMHKSRIYSIWGNMKSRCDNDSYPHYDRYGGRGIKYADKWSNFLGFKEDMYDSYNDHVKRHGELQTTLDRVDNDSNYNKDNTRWATRKEQVGNRGISRNNTSGYVGVGWSKQSNKWRSRVTDGGKDVTIGFFDSPIEAFKARENYLKTKETIT